MNEIQELFESKFRSEIHDFSITLGEEFKGLKGERLIVKDFPNLKLLDLRNARSLKELDLDNCPNLTSVKLFDNESIPLIVKDVKECSCSFDLKVYFILLLFFVWNIIISYLYIRNKKK